MKDNSMWFSGKLSRDGVFDDEGVVNEIAY
jgi:hypothetical protein